MALTQSAVSRQIQALEEEVGVALFLRHTRAVELTSAGAQLLRAVVPGTGTHGRAVRQIRQSAGRKACRHHHLGLVCVDVADPAAGGLPERHPDIDIRIDASDTIVDLDTADVDMALRYATRPGMPAMPCACLANNSRRWPAPGCSRAATRCAAPPTWRKFTLIEAGDAHRTQHLEWLTWRRWLDAHQLGKKLQPKRWLYFNYATRWCRPP
jgi:LysR family glycine cleavage system transcriptional activator